MTAVLYIMMRNDIDSMNPGKAIAQGSHASNAFVNHFHAYMQKTTAFPVNNAAENEQLNKTFYEWENSTSQGFGTVLVLEAPMKAINTAVDIFKELGKIAGVVHDPTYPIVDGSVVHYIPLDTCGYVFITNKEEDTVASALLKQFPLHR